MWKRAQVSCRRESFMKHLVFLLISAGGALPQTQPYYQTDFPAEEFRARWERIFSRIGNNSIAVVQGCGKVTGFQFPRQSNEFYYLTGVETPLSYLVLDGKTKRGYLFLPPRDERLERAEGRILSASDVDLAKRITGADEVLSTAELTKEWLQKLLGEKGTSIYTLFSPAEGYAESRHELQAANRAAEADAWDGRASREANLVSLLRQRLPNVEVQDLTAILDDLRLVKSKREIDLVRRASEIAGLALIEAMRTTKAGLFEYHLDAAARYVFLTHGARLDAYRSITAAGTANIWNMHYYRNNSVLRDGDLVLMDYAPDYHYYVSDVTRMWPVNGKYAPWQRELLQFVLEYRDAIIQRIRPGVTPKQIMKEAEDAMKPVLQRTKFSKPIYRQAAERLITSGGGVFSHSVGMAVHDDGDYSKSPLQPGHVFSIDPQLRVPEENLYIRYEDVVVVTEKGVENFTHFLPSQLDDIEREVKGEGVLQRYPPARITR